MIGFVGVGMMGEPMVKRLAGGGLEVLVHDADAERARELAELDGVTAAASPEALSQAQIVICMLPSSAIVEPVLNGENGLFKLLAPGTTVIDMGSSQPTSTRALALAAQARGLELVDAPVSGGVVRAVTGDLTIMFGGGADALARCRPVLELLGSTIVPVGDVGAGHAMKALNNLLSAIGLAAACEVIETGRRFGLDPHVMVDVLNRSTGGNHATKNKLEQFVLSGTFASGFGLRLMVKDMQIALGLAHDEQLEVPLGDRAGELWAAAAEALPADADHTAIARAIGLVSEERPQAA